MTSLFRKTMIAYTGVVVFAFAALFVSLHVEIKHFLVHQRLVVMNRESAELLPYLEGITNQHQVNPAFDRLVAQDKQVDNTSANIVLLRNKSSLQKARQLTKYLVKHDQIRNASEVARVLGGKRIQFVGPFTTLSRATSVTVGWPIQDHGQVLGALFLHTSIQDLHVGQITRVIFLMTAPILILSILILYFATKRFLRPLRRMSRAVRAIGQGDFGARVPVDSRDEVGQLALTFNEMAAQLEGLDATRTELIANVSHELRTPLTSVKGFVQGILEGVIAPVDHHRYLTTAYTELERLNAMLNSMLDLSAIETGHAPLHMEAVAWPEIVHGAYDRVRVRMEEKGIRWKVSGSAESITLWGDPERLGQVVFNLLDNAIRHTEQGEISVDSVIDQGQLRVIIADTGEGIAVDALPHIWERFYSLRKRETGAQPQGGLGLTITKHLVELMNGRIDVASTLGQGTTFTLRLPVLRR